MYTSLNWWDDLRFYPYSIFPLKKNLPIGLECLMFSSGSLSTESSDDWLQNAGDDKMMRDIITLRAARRVSEIISFSLLS